MTTGNQNGQEPTTDEQSQVPAKAEPDEPAETFSADYVRSLREEAAKHRTRAKSLEEQLKTQREAETDGDFETLYRETEGRLASFSSTAKAKLMDMRLREAAVKRGVNPEIAGKLAYPRDGLTVNDDLDIEGDIDGALADFLTPFIEAKPDPAQQKRPVTIGEHPQTPAPQQSTGMRGYAEAAAKALEKARL